MPLYMIILVSVIQGITEFLPVSSSGHLVLIPIITDTPYQGRTIDVAAHVGTLFAVIWFVRAELLAMTRSLLSFGKTDPQSFKLIWLLAVGTIPIIVAGFLVNSLDPSWLLDLRVLAIANLIFALALWVADKQGALTQRMADMRWGAAIFIGLAQITALIPGASRSGVTMTAARLLGFTRTEAAKFSLLLSIPAIAGAGLLKARDIAKTGDISLGLDALWVALLSAGFALVAIRWMMAWLAHANFTIFVAYRVALALLILGALHFQLL